MKYFPFASVEVKIILFGIIAVLLALWAYFSGYLKISLKEEGPKKNKGTLAKEYGVKHDTLLSWIKMFCSDDYIEKYVNTSVKKIPVNHLTFHLGEPENGKDFCKAALADSCFVHRNTLRRRLQKLPDFAEYTGISFEQYASLRILPPKIFKSVFSLHRLHYAS